MVKWICHDNIRRKRRVEIGLYDSRFQREKGRELTSNLPLRCLKAATSNQRSFSDIILIDDPPLPVPPPSLFGPAILLQLAATYRLELPRSVGNGRLTWEVGIVWSFGRFIGYAELLLRVSWSSEMFMCATWGFVGGGMKSEMAHGSTARLLTWERYLRWYREFRGTWCGCGEWCCWDEVESFDVRSWSLSSLVKKSCGGFIRPQGDRSLPGRPQIQQIQEFDGISYQKFSHHLHTISLAYKIRTYDTSYDVHARNWVYRDCFKIIRGPSGFQGLQWLSAAFCELFF